MKGRGKKNVKRIVSLVLATFLVWCTPMQEVEAAQKVAMEQASEMSGMVRKASEEDFGKEALARTAFSGCTIGVMYRSTGMLIEIRTGVTQKSPVVGVKDIEVYQKVWYGWKKVAYSGGGEGYETTGVVCSMTFEGAEVGETYRIDCVHYANMREGDVVEYKEAAASSGSFTYTN